MDNIAVAVNFAKKRLSEIVNADMKLKRIAYLVFSSRFGQCRLSVDRWEIFREFPAFFKDCDHHKNIKTLFTLWDKLKKIEADGIRKVKKDEFQTIENKIQDLLLKLEISEDIQIEFRFEELDYQRIQELKNHPLVKQPRHMMSPAYIVVVLDSLAELMKLS